VGTRTRIAVVTRDFLTISGKLLSARRHAMTMSAEYDVRLILFCPSEREEDWAGRVEFSHEGIECVRIFTAELATEPTNRLENYMRAQVLARIIRDQGISAFHCFGAFGKGGLVVRYAAETTGIPYMLSFRGTDLTLETFAEELAANRLAAEGAKICTFTNEEARRLGTSLFALSCPTATVPNSFDWSDFSPTGGQVPSYPRPVVGMCAYLWRVAGTDQLLSAFERLYPEVQTLLLIGELSTNESAYFQKRLSSMGCKDRVVITGWIPHEKVMAYLQSCDVLVFPSIAEGSPNKVLEAMASGVPAIAAAVGGIRDMITDGVHGLLFSDAHAEAIVEKVRYVLRNGTFAAECAKQARTRVAHEFTRDHEHALWNRCYEILLQ
jgi:glycosyltransferase involved in cell wall biosynthesis